LLLAGLPFAVFIIRGFFSYAQKLVSAYSLPYPHILYILHQKHMNLSINRAPSLTENRGFGIRATFLELSDVQYDSH